jgi:hypothetical protein
MRSVYGKVYALSFMKEKVKGKWVGIHEKNACLLKVMS